MPRVHHQLTCQEMHEQIKDMVGIQTQYVRELGAFQLKETIH